MHTQLESPPSHTTTSDVKSATLGTERMPHPRSTTARQILLQLAAARGLESVCLVASEEEAALAMKLGAWKAALLKEVPTTDATSRLG